MLTLINILVYISLQTFLGTPISHHSAKRHGSRYMVYYTGTLLSIHLPLPCSSCTSHSLGLVYMEYSPIVWNPYLKSHINSLEKVQKFAIKVWTIAMATQACIEEKLLDCAMYSKFNKPNWTVLLLCRLNSNHNLFCVPMNYSEEKHRHVH